MILGFKGQDHRNRIMFGHGLQCLGVYCVSMTISSSSNLNFIRQDVDNIASMPVTIHRIASSTQLT